ncbi:probable polygalacturonase At3g15720 [Andrographis paniculata]|uniref:probable polygalacturonase At3g15720 n=1 Tax=Andrographis paniculata TaxID=175694 RepID=UPI0021E8A455|nr:probable polygalacturonase At3g15720 [Andrographis paniculata]
MFSLLQEYFALILVAVLALLTSGVAAYRPFAIADRRRGRYDVSAFGAVGNGRTDDAKAFGAAWKAACEAKTSTVKIIVPARKSFLLSPIEFFGPCKPSKINFLISGTILAPQKSAYGNSYDTWLHFSGIDGLVVDGNSRGTIDGRGKSWWRKRPTALRFDHCNNLIVKRLIHKNSQRNHVSIDGCNNVEIANLSIQAPGNSPNTDGIDISSSTYLNIHDSDMSTGDDCIAINGGTSNVNITKINCGPGHGISIGSLGKNGRHDEVSGIRVTGCTFTKTQNGVRIKTWQGGSGYAKDITFADSVFKLAGNPVIIDQYYCPNSNRCPEKASAVKISGVKYLGLRGTSVAKDGAIQLMCSRTVSCDDIVVDNVDIKPASWGIPNTAKCTNVYGEQRLAYPSVTCLRKIND